MQTLVFIDATDGVLGDARFAALLARRLTPPSQVAEGQEMTRSADEKQQAEEEEEEEDGPSHGCSKAVELLVLYVFKEIEKISHRWDKDGEQIPRGSISGRLAALAVHCLNHTVKHEAVVGYLEELRAGGGYDSGKARPEDAAFAFKEVSK